MVIRINLDSLSRRAAFIVVGGSCWIIMLTLSFSWFAIGTLTDERARPAPSDLSAVANLFPASGRLNARLAETELQEAAPDLSVAEAHALAAARLAPYDYRNTALLALVKEAKGDSGSALQLTVEAAELAPNNVEIRWRLANLLLRNRRLDESLAELKKVVAVDTALLPAALDLVWRASLGRVDSLKVITGSEPDALMALASFLLKQSRTEAACGVFERVAADDRVALSKRAEFLSNLIEAGALSEARTLWLESNGESGAALMWNGGFEAGPARVHSRFDWEIKSSEYARLWVEPGAGRNGGRALRVEFTARETPRLSDEIKQLAVVRPGARYRLQCWIKTQSFAGETGPAITVIDAAANAIIGSSEPIPPGSQEWQLISVCFASPRLAGAGPAGVVIALRLTPRFAFERPAGGTIWLDDFELIEE